MFKSVRLKSVSLILIFSFVLFYSPYLLTGQTEPFVPNKVTKIEFDLRDKCHCFLKGHRIMVQIQSTWFPVIDRNPQKFVDIYHAKESDFQKAMHKVYRSAKYSSHLKLNVLQQMKGGDKKR